MNQEYVDIYEVLVPAKFTDDQMIEMRIVLVDKSDPDQNIKDVHRCRSLAKEIPYVLETWNSHLPENLRWQYFSSMPSFT